MDVFLSILQARNYAELPKVPVTSQSARSHTKQWLSIGSPMALQWQSNGTPTAGGIVSAAEVQRWQYDLPFCQDQRKKTHNFRHLGDRDKRRLKTATKMAGCEIVAATRKGIRKK